MCSHKKAVDYSNNSSPNPTAIPCTSHADHLLQLHESKTSKRLGEDVREVPTSFDELDDDLPSIDTVPEEVELYVNVFAPVVQNQILREGDGC